MDTHTKDASMDQWIREASFAFFTSEKELPKEDFLDKDLANLYLDTTQKLLYSSSSQNQFSQVEYSKFSVFLSYIVKSTLYFHYCFDHSIKEKNSKLALMYGDLYLAQSGLHFTKISNFLRMRSLLREVLFSIALSQKMQEKSKCIPFDLFQTIIKKSYGAIFRFVLISPYLWKQKSVEKRKLTEIGYNTALCLALHVNPYLSGDQTTNEIKNNVFLKLKNKIGEEKWYEYNFDGWEITLKKNEGPPTK